VRSLLFVPGDDAAKLKKACASAADALIIDLEDSVAPDQKRNARETTAAFLAGDLADTPTLYLRVNEFASGELEADLHVALSDKIAGVALPKARSGDDVRQLSKLLDGAEAKLGLHLGGIGIFPIATETPQSVLAIQSYADCGDRLLALTWGAEDLAAAIGATTNRQADGSYTPPFELARSLCLFAAAAAGVQAIDTVYTDFSNPEGLRAESERAVRDGFSSKMAIHPVQIDVINEVFTPSGEEVSRARAIVEAFEAAPGAGVLAIDGRMIDRPHLRQAENILTRAGQTERG
jgi:citrate lyase subunit beta/citryl-CoA lyase